MGGFLRGPVVACQQPVLLLGSRRAASHRQDGRALAVLDLLAQCNRRSGAWTRDALAAGHERKPAVAKRERRPEATGVGPKGNLL